MSVITTTTTTTTTTRRVSLISIAPMLLSTLDAVGAEIASMTHVATPTRHDAV